MENRDSVSYLVHESSLARQERTVKRLVVALIFAVVLMFTSNALWLLAWTSYDFAVEGEEATTTTTTDINGENGSVNYIGEDGDIVNGTGESK